MIKHRGPPSQTWRTFLRNHADAIAAIDLCLVPTVTFECLFAFLVVSHGRRQLLWFAVTKHATAEWLAQQIVEAFPWDTAPHYLIRALYYNKTRTHLGLAKDAPRRRAVQRCGRIVTTPILCGLHHRYARI